MITRRQLNIISNSVNSDSDGAARAAKKELAIRLFPEDELAICVEIDAHPINQRWDEYLISKNPESFLLLEY